MESGTLECRDCGRTLIEAKFHMMASEKCGWENGSALKYTDITDNNEGK